ARHEELARHSMARQAKLQDDVRHALEEAKGFYELDRWPEAMAAVKRAEDLLAGGQAGAELQRLADQWRSDIEMVVALEEIRLERASEQGDGDAAADQAFRQAFRLYGLEVESLEPDEAARRIGESVIKQQLIAALDDWLLAKHAFSMRGMRDRDGRKELPAAAQRLLTVARRADPDPFRDRLREALQRGNTWPLQGLA